MTQLLEGVPSRNKQSAAQEAEKLSRHNRRHPVHATSPTRSAEGTTVSPRLHLNEHGRPTRVVRMRQPPPPPTNNRSASVPRNRNPRDSSSDARPESRPSRSASAAPSRPRLSSGAGLTFAERVRLNRTAAGARPTKHRSGKRRISARHQYHEVDRHGKDFASAAVQDWELVVVAPAGKRTNTGEPLSLAHPE